MMRTYVLLYAAVMASLSSGFDQVDVSQLRTAYCQTVFTEDQLVSRTNPFQQFHAWFQAALQCEEILEPTAVCISTSTKDGKPSSRMVHMKSYTEKGLTIFADYKSEKGKELAENPHTALLFFWPPLHKQVRIEGKVQKLSEESFHSCPQMSQNGGAVNVSWQSTTVGTSPLY